jgi:hypothetical protein
LEKIGWNPETRNNDVGIAMALTDPSKVEKQVLRAIASVRYGSVEIIIHDGKVVQLECREKIRLGGEQHNRDGDRLRAR